MSISLRKFTLSLSGFCAALLVAAVHGCGRGGGGGCEGPALPVAQLEGLRKVIQSGASGPRGALIIPNPIEATGSSQILASDPRLSSVTSQVGLPGLLNPQVLENEFLKVRIRSIQDPASSLARPDGTGLFSYSVTDPHYSETMAYHSIQAMTGYVEALGFRVVRSRPLYVLVRAQSDDPQEVNAFYDHNYLNPNSPRMLRVFGETQYPLGADRDIFWHEFGHLFNESASREVGMDFAADAGAVYTEGSSLHECLADMLAMSVGNTPYIGRWIAKNFSDVPAGLPLRSAVDARGIPQLNFSQIIRSDGRGNSPERYQVAEWCTRVLWDVRTRFVQEDPEAGSMKFERMVWSAVGMLRRDSSIRNFHDALLQSDDKLHCGGHEDVIRDSFANRGFESETSSLSSTLVVESQPVAVDESTGSAGNPRPGSTIVFDLRIRNSNSNTARNVRVYFEPRDQGLIPVTYMQGYGDLSAGQVIGVGQGGGLDYGYSVQAKVDTRISGGQRLRYRLRIVPENGRETVLDRELQL